MGGEDGNTKGVEMLLGSPKKAVLAMAIPIVIAMVAQNVNNIIDSAWVAGLGIDALAAVGFSFPLFFIVIGIGNGIGIGASSAIARRIGKGDREGANSVASQAMLLTVIVGAALTVAVVALARPMYELMGAGDTVDLCMDYSLPIFVFLVPILLCVVFGNFLRAEGAAKRSMTTQLAGAIINIVIDPIFIYDWGLGLGVAGAGYATSVAMIAPMLIIAYWYYVKRDTYLRVPFTTRLDGALCVDIFRVGIPASLEMIVVSVISMFMNAIIIGIDSTDGVAVYTSVWKIVQMLMIPMLSISSAIVPVCAAAYGANRFDKVREAYSYSCRLSVAIMAALMAVTMVLARHFVYIFTYAESAAALTDEMADCLRILCLLLPFAGWGAVSAGLFQSLGMGTKSLVSSATRNAMQIPFALAVLAAGGSLTSLWYSVSAAEVLGSVITALWALAVLRALMRGYVPKAAAEGPRRGSQQPL